MTRREVALAIVALMIASSALAFARLSLIEPAAAKVIFFAEVVKYPLPSIPEPVLKGGTLVVHVAAPKDASGWAAEIRSKYGDHYVLELVNATYYAYRKLWIVCFRIPANARPTLYNLTLSFKAGGKSFTIEEPRSVWVLERWPDKLRILFGGDTKTPGGWPYYIEFVRVTNLLNPDLLIFDGDEVESPTIKSAWELFIEGLLMWDIPTYCVIGNHEYSAGDASIYESILGYRNYTITIGKFLFIMMDTGEDGWIPMSQLRWAERVLRENPDKVKIMVFHHPLFGYKVKDERIGTIKISGPEDFDKLASNGYLYGSWYDHLKEAKYLFTLIIKYDVRFIFTAHTHTDINVIVIDGEGRKHYFITGAAVAYDVRDYDIRGFRLVTIYANGTVDEKTLFYDGKDITDYPNSIPIDRGEKVLPYEIGLIEYYYAPRNDGKSKAVSFRALNKLNQTFYDIKIEFRLPKDVPLNAYRWYPAPPPAYEVIEGPDCYFVILHNVTLPARGVVKYTIAAINDTDAPSIVSAKYLSNETDGKRWWWLIVVNASDGGWGVDEVRVHYMAPDGSWKPAALLDLTYASGGAVGYIAWIPVQPDTKSIKVKVEVTDFAGHATSGEFEVAPPKPKPPAEKPSPPPAQPPRRLPAYAIIAIAAVAAIVIVALVVLRARRRV